MTMSDPKELLELLERVEKASGPDRELDGAICIFFGWTHQKMKGDAQPYFRKPGVTNYWDRSQPPYYTASLDAALALVEANCPPAVAVQILKSAVDAVTIRFAFTGENSLGFVLVRFVLVAFLRALIAQQETTNV